MLMLQEGFNQLIDMQISLSIHAIYTLWLIKQSGLDYYLELAGKSHNIQAISVLAEIITELYFQFNGFTLSARRQLDELFKTSEFDN